MVDKYRKLFFVLKLIHELSWLHLNQISQKVLQALSSLAPHVRLEHLLDPLVREYLWLSSYDWLYVHFLISSSNVSIASLVDAENFLNVVFIIHCFFNFSRIVIVLLVKIDWVLAIEWVLIRGLWKGFLGVVTLMRGSGASTHHLVVF